MQTSIGFFFSLVTIACVVIQIKSKGEKKRNKTKSKFQSY